MYFKTYSWPNSVTLKFNKSRDLGKLGKRGMKSDPVNGFMRWVFGGLSLSTLISHGTWVCWESESGSANSTRKMVRLERQKPQVESEIPVFGRIGKREVKSCMEDRQEVQTDRKRTRSVSELRCLDMRSRSSLGSWDQSAIFTWMIMKTNHEMERFHSHKLQNKNQKEHVIKYKIL